MYKNKKSINILSISSYGFDLGVEKGDVFSGAQARQIEYSSFMDKYIIIAPTIDKSRHFKKVSLKEGLDVYNIYYKNIFTFLYLSYKLSLKLIKKEDIQVIMCDNPFTSALVGVYLKKKFGLPLLIHSMAEMIDNPHYLKERKVNFIKNFLAKRNIKFADIIRVSTQAEIDAWKGKYKEKLFNAPFYIDPEKFDDFSGEDNIRTKLLEDSFEKIVLYLGRIAPQKDILTLIEAASKVVKNDPKVLFVLVGDGPDHGLARKKIEELDIQKNIKLLGKIPYTDVVKYFKACDLFAISSIYEGTCMVLHEAALMSKPIVATKFAGARDFVLDNENGYLVNIKDSKDFAEKIIEVLKDAQERMRMGENAKKRVVEKFNRNLALDKYNKMIIKLVNIN